MKKMLFERSPDTEAVILVLRGVNQDISYPDLARRAGLGVARAKSVLTSAKRVLLKEQMLFGSVRGYGVRRLTAVEGVAKSEDNKKRLYRAAGRSKKELEAVDLTQLLPRDQLVATTNRTIFSMVKSQTRQAMADAPPRPQQNILPNVTAIQKKVS